MQAAFARHGESLAVFHDLERRVHEAERTVGGRRAFRLSRVSTRRDNVFVVYPGGAPRNVGRLRRILDDIDT